MLKCSLVSCESKCSEIWLKHSSCVARYRSVEKVEANVKWWKLVWNGFEGQKLISAGDSVCE